MYTRHVVMLAGAAVAAAGLAVGLVPVPRCGNAFAATCVESAANMPWAVGLILAGVALLWGGWAGSDTRRK